MVNWPGIKTKLLTFHALVGQYVFGFLGFANAFESRCFASLAIKLLVSVFPRRKNANEFFQKRTVYPFGIM